MFTSFFSKSKPINFLIIGIFMTIYYSVENFALSEVPVTPSYFFRKMGLLLVYLLLMILVNFIVKKNQVTQRNTFAIVLFALFTVSFSEILKTGGVLIAAFFILLALRRIISLKSGIDIKKKIFDASLWICTASLFFEYCLFFLLLVFLAILFYVANDYRNWLIPFVAVFSVFTLFTCFHLLVHGSFVDLSVFFRPPDFHFALYSELEILLPLSLMLAFSIWTVANYLVVIKNASTTMKSSLVLILAIWAVSIFAVVFSPTKNGGELLFIIIPVSVIGTNYFQQKEDKIFKEILLVSLVVLTFILPFLS
ncbi:MAG TPA: DUF6427 family protein [Flavobacteriaceae bacterium]|nr:DUF6427 family protein [Flavobacteriaceae bacterium]